MTDADSQPDTSPDDDSNLSDSTMLFEHIRTAGSCVLEFIRDNARKFLKSLVLHIAGFIASIVILIFILWLLAQVGANVPTDSDTVAPLLMGVVLVTGLVFLWATSLEPTEKKPQYKNYEISWVPTISTVAFNLILLVSWNILFLFIVTFIAAEDPPIDSDVEVVRQLYILSETTLLVFLAISVTEQFKKIHVRGIEWGRKEFTARVNKKE